jgi:hypothetical protein
MGNKIIGTVERNMTAKRNMTSVKEQLKFKGGTKLYITRDKK